jgi:hypothetical protein
MLSVRTRIYVFLLTPSFSLLLFFSPKNSSWSSCKPCAIDWVSVSK